MTAAIGCGEPSATVYIDNAGKATMIVKVDGQPAASIEAGEFTMLRLPPGEHKFHVSCGGRTLFDGTKTLDAPKRFASPRRYILSPDGQQRYAASKVVYGSQLFADATESAIVKLAEHHTGQKVDPIRLEFMQVKRFAEPMPASDWFELPRDVFYVLRAAPEVVYSRTGSDSRRVLTRISPQNHSQLWRGHAVKNPTERDLALLTMATENALDSMAELEPIY
jgi:hypothetical protein